MEAPWLAGVGRSYVHRADQGGQPNRESRKMDVPEEILAAELKATELYWGSDTSVNQIAEELDLSKSALYGVIHPLPTGLGCPLCQNEVVFANRTARQRRKVSCPVCAWDGSEDETVPDVGGDTEPVDEVELPPPAAVGRGVGRVALGGALLGAAAGLALVLWARRR